MTLAAGSKLGPYEILGQIGAGGMGEVYRARDTRLERTVAVKVLPPHMSAFPESRQRSEREAKTISQLSHPHICYARSITQFSPVAIEGVRRCVAAAGPVVTEEGLEVERREVDRVGASEDAREGVAPSWRNARRVQGTLSQSADWMDTSR
jgi:Protein kinase domain